jgi:hypothetical protein
MDFPPSILPAPYKKTGTLVILWTRDFRAHSEMVSNKRMRSLMGRLKGVEGWEGGESEGEKKRGGGYLYFRTPPPPHSRQLNHIDTVEFILQQSADLVQYGNMEGVGGGGVCGGIRYEFTRYFWGERYVMNS